MVNEIPEETSDANESTPDSPVEAAESAEAPEALSEQEETVASAESVAAEPNAESGDETTAAKTEAAETKAAETNVAAESTADSGEEAAPALTLGEGAPAERTDGPIRKPVIRGKIDRFGVAMGTGRRKSSVARVRIKEGDGKLSINGRSLDGYFQIERDRNNVEAPLRATESSGKVDVWVRVQGGGTTGQAGAIVLGIARALQAMDPNLHEKLAEGGYLTRDSRMVERKKYGYKKARKSFQFSKR
jgi:small subunit ribosomal protein S9